VRARVWFRSANIKQKDYNGPFILWAVDEPNLEEEEEESADEA
jgi:hypothetical protein